MEASEAEGEARVSLMTLHAAKGLEFETVFLPGWEEGLLPNQRALDESGKAGLEEERRLAHVGLTRARRRAKLSFATNRRIHGMWNATVPSRFLDELPPGAVDVLEAPGAFAHGGYGASRFDRMAPFASRYDTPGWRRAQAQQGASGSSYGRGEAARIGGPAGRGYGDRSRQENDSDRPVFDRGGAGRDRWGREAFGFDRYEMARDDDRAPQGGWERRPARSGFGSGRPEARRGPSVIEGDLVATSTGSAARFTRGERVFHLKFGPGSVAEVDGNKLTVDFDKAGRKMVLDSFVERAG